MPELVQLLPEVDETDRRIVELRVSGVSEHEIAQRELLPLHEVLRRLDRNLPQIDAAARRRAISLSLLRIDELTETFQKLAKTGDLEAGNLMVRLEAERRALLGLTGSGYDPVQLVAHNRDRESSHAAIERSLMRLAKPINGQPEAGPSEPGDVGADK